MTKYNLSHTYAHARTCTHESGCWDRVADIFQPQGCHFSSWQDVTIPPPSYPHQKRGLGQREYIHVMVLVSLPLLVKVHRKQFILF